MDISPLNKFLFYLSYPIYKFIYSWVEVKNHKLKLFAIEFFYSFGKFYIPLEGLSYKIKIDYLETIFGKFYLRPGTMDIICASPAFERRDINYLIDLLAGLKKKHKKILFIDAGADFGYYSVVVGNYLKGYNKFSIYSFEPVSDSFLLLKKNIVINKLASKTTLCNYALLDKNKNVTMKIDKLRPGDNMIVKTSQKKDKIKVRAQTLDSLSLYRKDFDVVIVKIDVQGVETELIKGALNTLRNIEEAHLLVEDFYETKIIDFLKSQKFKMVDKITTYNSWWRT